MIILGIWETAYRLIGWRTIIYPAPSAILLSFKDLWGMTMNQEPVLLAPLTSLSRLAIGFSISIALGTLLGAAMWSFRPLDRLLGGPLLGLQTLPSVCWVPLAIAMAGLDEAGILFVLTMGTTFAVTIALRDGLKMMPPVYRRAGLMLGAHGWRLYRYVLLPAAMPALVGGLRQGFSFAWRSLMGAEMMLSASRLGLGTVLSNMRSNFNVSDVVALMIVMVLIGMAADRWIFAALQRRVQRRFGLE